jgi:DNA-directed RNA polymerase subunit N
MIIPIRCFTCNSLIAHKWKNYTEKIQLEYLKDDVINNQKKRFINVEDIKNKSIEGKILDELKVHKYCCRRIFLSQVDMAELI